MPQRPLSAGEKARLAELVAARTPFWKICEEIGRSRWTTPVQHRVSATGAACAAEAVAVAAVAGWAGGDLAGSGRG
jgi:hypothetical protein